MPLVRNPQPLKDSDLPSTIARDTETEAAVAAAVAAHMAATDPHLQYPTQARADARYVRFLNSFDETIVAPINLAANTWNELGSARVVGEQGKGATWDIGVYFQYTDGGMSQPYFQYYGTGVLPAIFWQADFLTNEGISLPFEAHNEADFTARIRFGRGQARKLEIKPVDRSINIVTPGFIRISGVRRQI